MTKGKQFHLYKQIHAILCVKVNPHVIFNTHNMLEMMIVRHCSLELRIRNCTYLVISIKIYINRKLEEVNFFLLSINIRYLLVVNNLINLPENGKN